MSPYIADVFRNILMGSEGWEIATARTAAYAEQICAALNACAGINPEAVPDLLAALKKYVGKFGNCGDVYDAGRAAIAKAEEVNAKAEEVHAELLDACKGILSAACDCTNPELYRDTIREIARAAIAKAEGGEA